MQAPRSRLSDFVSAATIFDLTAPIVDKTIELRKSYAIKLPDEIIAATALFHDCKLISRNLKDFAKIAGLTTIDPHTILFFQFFKALDVRALHSPILALPPVQSSLRYIHLPAEILRSPATLKLFERLYNLCLGKSCSFHAVQFKIKAFCLILNCLRIRGTYRGSYAIPPKR
jgi:hypothetical protein